MNRKQRRLNEKNNGRKSGSKTSLGYTPPTLFDVDDNTTYEVGGMTIWGKQLRELIRSGYVSKNGIFNGQIFSALEHLGRVFPELKLKVLDQEQDDVPEVTSSTLNRFPFVGNENNFTDEKGELSTTAKAEIKVQAGVEAKRRGDYKSAIELYEQALRIAPDYLQCYYAIGKIYYILESKEKSVLYYTIAAHIHASVGAAQDLSDEIRVLKERRIQSFPEDLVNHFKSVHRQAIMLLVDDNTPRHIGHTLIDLPVNIDASREIIASRESYRDLLCGKPFKQMDFELEDGMYHSIGASYLLERIQWEKVGKHPLNDVLRLYTDADALAIPDAICETLISWVFQELTASIGLRHVVVGNPFQTLVHELSSLCKQYSGLREDNTVARQALQASEKLLSSPYDIICGPLILDSFEKGNTSKLTMIKRWSNTSKLVQTPAIDFFFDANSISISNNLRAPVLRSIIYALKDYNLIKLRNGLVHESYQWEGDDYRYLNIMLGADVERQLSISTCEAFHGLIVICALALSRVLK